MKKVLIIIFSILVINSGSFAKNENGLLTHAFLGLKSSLELDGAIICISKKNSSTLDDDSDEKDIKNYFNKHKMYFELLYANSHNEALNKFKKQKCDVYVDSIQILERIAKKNPKYQILYDFKSMYPERRSVSGSVWNFKLDGFEKIYKIAFNINGECLVDSDETNICNWKQNGKDLFYEINSYSRSNVTLNDNTFLGITVNNKNETWNVKGDLIFSENSQTTNEMLGIATRKENSVSPISKPEF